MPSKRFSRGRETAVLAIGIWSLAFWAMFGFVPTLPSFQMDREAFAAARLMAEAEEAIRACRKDTGLDIDLRSDPNRTGLIGLEDSPISTSLGQLEAKRTTTNPNFAAAVVFLLREAGVRRGDPIAIGASSSFPGLILATLAASREMGLRPLLIASLGASHWGANDPRWTWLEISDCLRRQGLIDVPPLAVSVGGEADEGRDMTPRGRELLQAKIARSGLRQILEPDLPSDVKARMALFEQAASGVPLKAFINIGGSWVNMGTDAEVLKLRPGVNRDMAIPPPSKRGLIQEMAARGIPVIHLLYVKGLADRLNLPWDPVPLPGPGEGPAPSRPLRNSPLRIALLAIYFAGVVLGAVWLVLSAGLSRKPEEVERIFSRR